MEARKTSGNANFLKHLRDWESGLKFGTEHEKFAKDSRDFVQRLQLYQKLPVHRGCVNSIVWSESGQLVLSASDDQRLIITNPFDTQNPVLARIPSGHSANIFAAKFLPQTNNNFIVSCAGDGGIILTEVDRPDTYGKNLFACHVSTTYEIATIPNDPYTFLSCAEDGTIRCFDRRTKMCCTPCQDDVLIDCRRACCALDVSPRRPYLIGVGVSDGTARIYDFRKLSKPTQDSTGLVGLQACFSSPSTTSGRKAKRITSLDFCHDSDEFIVSFSSDYVYLVDMNEFSSETVNVAAACDDEMQKLPLKKLRLRGDWSDTGPEARPERERQRQEEQETRNDEDQENSEGASGSNRSTLGMMERFSQLLTHWLERQIAGDVEGDERASVTISPAGLSENSSGTTAESAAPTESSEQSVAAGSSETTNENVDETQGVEPATVYGGAELDDFSASLDVRVKLSTMSSCCSTVKVNVKSEDDLAGGQEQPQSSQVQAASVSAPEILVEPPQTPPRTSEQTPEESEINENRGDVMESEQPGSSSMTDPVSLSGQFMFRVRRGLRERRENEGDEESPSSSRMEASESAPQPPPPQSQSAPSQPAPPQMDDENRNRESRRREILVRLEAEARRRQERKQELLKAIQQMPQLKCKMVFTGHRNARTMLKQASYWGNNFMMSGSDCGHVFIWNRHSGELVMLLEGDKHVVNCVQPHPYYPILATSGIDYDVKLWAPIAAECQFNQESAVKLMKRNEIMLAETKDTVTVPATFMIQMIASMNRVRSARRQQQQQQMNETERNAEGNEEDSDAETPMRNE